MKTIAVFTFWFGELPVYFDAWLQSAIANPTIDFFIYTDHPSENVSNIEFIMMTEKERETLFEGKLNYEVSISIPVQVCNLLPMVGEVFSEKLREYDYWGYCEFDMAFGDIRGFVTEEILDTYDRIYPLGHFTLYKNNDAMNGLYRQPGSIYKLEDVCNGKAPAGFVEYLGIDRISRINKIAWYTTQDFGDCYSNDKPFRMMFGPENHDGQIFYWENGHLYQVWYDAATVPHSKELVYFHWQQKIPVHYSMSSEVKGYYITTSGLLPKTIEGMPSLEECKRLVDMQSSVKNTESVSKGSLVRRKIESYLNRDKLGRSYMRKFYLYALFGRNPRYSDPLKYLFHQ